MGHSYYTLTGSGDSAEDKVNGGTERTSELEEEVDGHVMLSVWYERLLNN